MDNVIKYKFKPTNEKEGQYKQHQILMSVFKKLKVNTGKQL